jgi:hypothetical protein
MLTALSSIHSRAFFGARRRSFDFVSARRLFDIVKRTRAVP